MLFVIGFVLMLAEPTRPIGILVPLFGVALVSLEIIRLRKEEG